MADIVDLEQLDLVVARMRTLGVTRLRSITLGLEIDLTPDAPIPADAAPDAASGDEDEANWDDATGDVYTDPYSYPHGVPGLKKFTE